MHELVSIFILTTSPFSITFSIFPLKSRNEKLSRKWHQNEHLANFHPKGALEETSSETKILFYLHKYEKRHSTYFQLNIYISQSHEEMGLKQNFAPASENLRIVLNKSF